MAKVKEVRIESEQRSGRTGFLGFLEFHLSGYLLHRYVNFTKIHGAIQLWLMYFSVYLVHILYI